MAETREETAVRIMIVEDEPSAAAALHDLLETMGYSVCAQASTGQEALDLAEARRPDLILMDIVLPGPMDGIEAASRIREKLKIPIVFNTAYDERERLERAKLVEPFGYLVKPYQARDVRSTIEMGLYKARMDEQRLQAEAALRQAHDELEKRVEERTAELTEANVNLLREIDERKRYEEQLQLAASVFENTIEGIIITDQQGTIESVNAAFTAITGYQPEEVVGRNPSLLQSGRQGREFYERLWRQLLKEGQWSGEIWNRRKSGEAYPQWLAITMLRNEAGEISRFVGVFHDITDIKQSEEQLKYQAHYDALTGLPNRQLFNDRLNNALAQARRNRNRLAVLFLDLDHFKNINDSLGHPTGDVFLQKVAERLKSCCREEDTVARLGGDEFILILPGVKGAQDAVTFVQRVMDYFAEPITLSGQKIFPRASIGITLFPFDGQDPETLVRNADMAMYKAKEKGRNTYAMFTEAMNEEVRRNLMLENSLRHGLRHQEFGVFYQPKIDLATGGISGVEALVRWHRDPGEPVGPSEFISLAEDTGLIFPLGEWIFKTACRQARTWQNAGFEPLSMAVNLSPKQFRHEYLLRLVEATLDETGLPPNLLNLEITENIIMLDVDAATKTMTRLAGMGVHISIDDFGIGYSSLNYLRRFPLNVLKIDKSFVQEIPHSADDIAIIKAILSIARSMNLKVVAEGVETLEQLAFVRDEGCHEMQGFLFSRPVPAERCTDILTEGARLPI